MFRPHLLKYPCLNTWVWIRSSKGSFGDLRVGSCVLHCSLSGVYTDTLGCTYTFDHGSISKASRPPRSRCLRNRKYVISNPSAPTTAEMPLRPVPIAVRGSMGRCCYEISREGFVNLFPSNVEEAVSAVLMHRERSSSLCASVLSTTSNQITLA